MSEEIVLYYNPMSRARIAHWTVEEVGAPIDCFCNFDRRRVSLAFHRRASVAAEGVMAEAHSWSIHSSL